MSNSVVLRALSFPRVRSAIARLTHVPVLGNVAMLAGLLLATVPYIVLRSLADGWRAPVDGSLTERSLFGGLPSVALQDRLRTDGYGLMERMAVSIHASWFIVLAAITLMVAWRWRQEFASYAAWYLGVMYLALVLFIAMPMQPPWYSDPDVTRIVALRSANVWVDANVVAAFPAVHVALPLAIAAWASSRRHRLFAAIVAGYALAVSAADVFLGEHYVIDVIGAAAVAAIVFAADAAFREFRHRDASAAPAASLSRPRLRPAERGQNLIEFALMFPAILLFIGVIVVFGLMLHTRSNLQQAVREGARQAAVGASLAQVQTLAAGNANETIVPADIRWCFPNGTGKVGDPVKVYIYKSGAAGYPYQLVPTGGTFDAVFGASALTVRMGPTATTRLEHSVTASVVSAAGACPS